MTDITYTIVEHDGGWAYKLDGVFSETFHSRAAAEAAAATVAAEQGVPGETEAISWQDEQGAWHEELERGDDRPTVHVDAAGRHASAAAGPRAPATGRDFGPRGQAPRSGILDARGIGTDRTLIAVVAMGLAAYLIATLSRRRR